MKKILAVLLAVVMTVGILPVAVFAAAPTEITATTYADDASVVLGNGNYIIPEGETVQIGYERTWTVNEGTTLTVYGKLEIKGTLTVNGIVTGAGNTDGKGIVVVKCWAEGLAHRCGVVVNSQNIRGNESGNAKRYFAEVYIPKKQSYDGFAEEDHSLRVKYLTSRTGSDSDYLYSDLYIENLAYLHDENVVETPKWYFADVYANDNTNYDDDTGILTVPLNQYLFLHFDFLDHGTLSKKYDGNRMAIKFNGVVVDSVQGVCTQLIASAGVIEYWPAEIARANGASYNSWKDSYFLRQERIYIPSGTGYTAYGVNGEISGNDQTVRLNYGDEFKFRVKIDSSYSDSAYAVYLVQGYQWDSRNYEDSMDMLVDATRVDDNGNLVHYVWKFEPGNAGANRNAYVDELGVYHIAHVEDEYTIVVTGVVSNEVLSFSANLMDTIRNLLNAIKQFFDRVKQMLGL